MQHSVANEITLILSPSSGLGMFEVIKQVLLTSLPTTDVWHTYYWQVDLASKPDLGRGEQNNSETRV